MIEPVALLRSAEELTAQTERLRLAWHARDLTAVQGAVSSLTLLDSGVETERYSVASLTTGPGRWILDQFSAITATRANTRLVGDTAILKAPNGDRFALRLVGQTWRLTSLWRKSP